MKVQILRSLGSSWPVLLLEGEEATVDKDVGELLIQSNLAIAIDSPKPKKPQAVAKPKKDDA